MDRLIKTEDKARLESGRIWVKTLIVLCLVGPAPTRGEPGVTPDEILIGSCSALKGLSSDLGNQQLEGAKAYIEFINSQGGVRGRKIKLVTFDDGYDTARAAECFDRLLERKIFAAAFFTGSGPAIRYMALAEK